MTLPRPEEVGIAILSTDRPHCLERLLKSIADHTNMKGMNVLVMDDSEDLEPCLKICGAYPWALLFHMGKRIGVARNTNAAMRGLSGFPYKIIMNNDVEITKKGWWSLYPVAMQQTGIHHFCFQQEGLWGAGTHKRPQEIQEIGGRKVKTIHDFPQGAILAYDQKASGMVGYFDAKEFNGYGKSHWDWSFRVSNSGIQPEGIHDLPISNEYFKVHDEACTTESKTRIDDYQRNTKVLERLRQDKSRIFVNYA